MKAEKLSTEIAALERQSGKAKNAVLKKVLTGKINKLKAELESITSAASAKEKIKKAKTKIGQMTAKEFSDYIKKLAKDPKFSFLKGMTDDEINRDIKRTAKPVGWRFRGRENVKKPTRKDIKEKNDVYYEGRRNRSDVSRSVRLAEGGGIANYLITPMQLVQLSDGSDFVEPYYSLSFRISGSLSEANEAAQKYVKTNDTIISANVTKIHPSGQPLKNKKVSYVTKDEIKKLAEGGGVDINDLDMPVIRTQFEEEEYEYAKGGSIGDSGTITDKKSMFVGKMGTITGYLGNMYEVMVLDNGNKRTVLVKKNGISVVSDEYAKGGGIWEIKDSSSNKVLSTHKTKKEARFAIDKILDENKEIEWVSISKKGFDDSHEFANGGNTGEGHRNEMSGMMKHGGNVEKYPELRKISDKIAEKTAVMINTETQKVSSKMPYKAQWVLEEVIKDLEKRV
jgi:hypothetical protein